MGLCNPALLHVGALRAAWQPRCCQGDFTVHVQIVHVGEVCTVANQDEWVSEGLWIDTQCERVVGVCELCGAHQGRLGHPLAGCAPLHPGTQQRWENLHWSSRVHFPTLYRRQILAPVASWETCGSVDWKGRGGRTAGGRPSRKGCGLSRADGILAGVG